MRSACSSQAAKFEVDQFHLKSFSGLFLICGLACFLSLTLFFLLMVYKFTRHYCEEPEFTSQSSMSVRLQMFISFINEKEAFKSRSTRRQMEVNSNRDGTVNGSSRRYRDISSNRSASLEGASNWSFSSWCKFILYMKLLLIVHPHSKYDGPPY